MVGGLDGASIDLYVAEIHGAAWRAKEEQKADA